MAIFLSSALPALATEPKPADVRKLICHGPNEERQLEIVAKGNGCILLYTKQKEAKEVAHAQSSEEPCKAAMKKIRDRLESGNFACE